MDINSFDVVFGVIMEVSVDIRNISGHFLYINNLSEVQGHNCILNLKKNKYLFQKWCIKVVNNNQRGSSNLAVNLALNEIPVHKVVVDTDTPLFGIIGWIRVISSESKLVCFLGLVV